MLKAFMCTFGYILHQLNLLLGTKLYVFTSSSLNFDGAFQSDHVAACSTALRSATEANDSCGHVAVPCRPKVKQRTSTADWLKF